MADEKLARTIDDFEPVSDDASGAGPRRLFAGNARKDRETSGNAGSTIAVSSGSPDAGTANPVEISEKRKRGRPRKTDDSASASASADGKPDAKPDARKPTEKKVSATPLKKGEVKTDSVEKIAEALAGIHMMLAFQLKAPEFELSEVEAQKVAEAAANVAAWYKVDLAGSSRLWDWGVLAYTVTLIYLPRVGKYAARQKQAARPIQTKGI